jgi:hypothetical protein
MFPTEIEADFAHWYPNDSLLDWHRGTRDQEHGMLLLSSRRLIVLLAGLPARSNYKTSQRGGYLSEAELVVYETYNEIAKLRASYYAVKGGEESRYEPFEFLDPIVRIEAAIAEELRDEELETASEQLYGDMGL